MVQPCSVTTDLVRMKEQREYETSEGEERQKGQLHYRNCKTGCPAYRSYEEKVTDADALRRACNECPLAAGPGDQARQIERSWMLPDSVLKLDRRPYWFVNAVSLLRLMNRSGF